MKRTLTFIVSILFFIVLVLVLPKFNPPVVSAQGASSAVIAQQVTPTPQIIDTSIIGSTDGILIMGIVIVAIVTLPLLLHKKRK